MLKRLTAKSNGYPVIQLAQFASGYVYSLDSVNLIVGNSGSGKTKLLRDVVEQLCGEDNVDHFYVDGDTTDLGVVFYSASPLHKGVGVRFAEDALFSDASPSVFEYKDSGFGRGQYGSGNTMLAHQYSAISSAAALLRSHGARKLLVLIDGADMLLDMQQQRGYVAGLEKALEEHMGSADVQSVQVILTAHSPLIASDIFHGSITVLGADPEQKIKGFASPMQSIINYTFATPTIGVVAERSIKKIDADKSKSMPGRDVVTDEIGDDFIKNVLKR